MAIQLPKSGDLTLTHLEATVKRSRGKRAAKAPKLKVPRLKKLPKSYAVALGTTKLTTVKNTFIESIVVLNHGTASASKSAADTTARVTKVLKKLTVTGKRGPYSVRFKATANNVNGKNPRPAFCSRRPAKFDKARRIAGSFRGASLKDVLRHAYELACDDDIPPVQNPSILPALNEFKCDQDLKGCSPQTTIPTNPTSLGADTIGVYRSTGSTFFLRNSNTDGVSDITATYGVSGDIPISGDWNGDKTDTIGIYRPTSHYFQLRNSNTSGTQDISAVFTNGANGDLPVVGDWNGDGVDTIGIYRPQWSTFRLRNSNTNGVEDIIAVLGVNGDIPIAGDWNGDGIDTIGVYRPSDHYFRLRNSNTSGTADVIAYFTNGADGDLPVVGDWNGDGVDTIGIYRPQWSTFRLRNSNTTGVEDITPVTHGVNGDTPVAANWDGQ